MSILHVDLKMPGGTYSMEPSDEATTFVWNVPSNLSSALKETQMIWSKCWKIDVEIRVKCNYYKPIIAAGHMNKDSSK